MKKLIAAGLTIGLALVVVRVITFFIDEAPVVPELRQFVSDR